MNIPVNVIVKAYRMVADTLETGKWPGDLADWWVEIDANWDLNFWSDLSQDPPLRCATIYEVINGRIQTQTFKRIFENDYVDTEVK